MKNLIIIGVGGFAREVAWHSADAINYGEEFRLKGFIDGDKKIDECFYEKLELPLLGDVFSYQIADDDVFVCAVGDTKIRDKLTKIIKKRGGKFFNLIHKTAVIAPNIKLGEGVIIGPMAIVGSNAILGNHVLITDQARVGHDSVVGNCVTVISTVSGGCEIGERVFVGVGANIAPRRKIGNDAFISAGSIVIKNVEPYVQVLGNPALPYKIKGELINNETAGNK